MLTIPEAHEEPQFYLYDELGGYAADSRKKRSFIASNDYQNNFMDQLEYPQEPEHKEKRATSIDEVNDISNALEDMMNTNYQVEKPKTFTEESSVNELMTPIEGVITTELPMTRFEPKVEEDFSDVLDIERSLDTTLPPITETTMSNFLLTEIPQISRKTFEVVTTLEQLLASAPGGTTSYQAPTVDSKEIFHEDLDAEEDTEEVREEKVKPTTEMVNICKKKEKVTETKQTAEVTKPYIKHKGKTTDWDQVIYPLEIETMEPEEEEEEISPYIEPATTESDTPPTTVEECAITNRVRIIPEEKKENDTDYYVDIVIPYDTDEQQEYIDRFVKRDEPSYYDFPSYSRRVQRRNADKQIWKDFDWPEHKKYGSTDTGSITSTQRELEVIGEGTESNVESEKSGKSEDRQIWKEFKWPEHKTFGSSNVESLPTTQREIEVLGEEKDLSSSLGKSESPATDDKQIWKEFKWPDHKKYGDEPQVSLTTTENYIEALSQEKVSDEDKSAKELHSKEEVENKQIWKEFNWPDQRKFDSIVLTSTEKQIEELNKDEDRNIWEEFSWPEQKEYKTPWSSSTPRMHNWKTNTWQGKQVQSTVRGNSGNVWEGFKWPEHRKYGKQGFSSTPQTTGYSSVGGNKNIWQQFNWPQHENYGSSTARWQGFPVPGTELPSKDGFDDYELGIAGRPSFSESPGFPPRPKIPAKFGQTEATSEWDQFNLPSENHNEFRSSTSDRYGDEYSSFPSKERITYSSDVQLNTVPMEEFEELGVPTGRSHGVTIAKDEGEELERFDWSEGSTIPTPREDTAGPHVMKTGLWEELHLPFHKSAHMKVIPETTPWYVEHTTYRRLERTTSGGDVWNKFQWPQHKKYSTSESALWNKIFPPKHKTAHFKVIRETTEGNSGEENGNWRNFNWPGHKNYSKGGATEGPHVMETEIWNKMHLPFHKKAHVKVVNAFTLSEENGNEKKVLEDLVAVTNQLMEEIVETTPPEEKTKTKEIEEDYLEKLENEKEHTTKIIEQSFNPEELTSKTYILEGTESKTTTDIWEAFQWPSPRTHTHTSEDTSGERLQKTTLEPISFPVKDFENIENTTTGSEEQADEPEISLDLFAFPPLEMKTERTNLTLLDIPVPPFPLPEEYEEYSMHTSTESSWSAHENDFSDLEWPYPHEFPSETFAFVDTFEGSSPPESSASGSVAPFYSLSEFTLEPKQEKPFWDHAKKKVHHHKTTSTTEGFPTKHTSPPTKSTTVGERLELAEEIEHKNYNGPSTEPHLNGPLKVAQERTFHTPVKESEDDDNLWDFRVLSEEEVVTFHPKTKKPTQKKTTIYSFKPIGTTADDWDVFNELPKEEVTKPLSEPTTPEKKTTFYVVITKPTEPVEPFEEVGETEKTLLEPPPPIAPPGAVEQSSEYYDEDREESTLEYEFGIEDSFSKENEKVNITSHIEKLPTNSETEAPSGDVEEFETVTFRVSEVFAGPTEPRTTPIEEAEVKVEDNVELVTFRSFETYPTASRASDSINEVMENLKEENGKNSFIDSLQLELVTFRKPEAVPEERSSRRAPHLLEPLEVTTEELRIELPEAGIPSVDKDNLMYALTEPNQAAGVGPKEVGEATTKIIEGEKVLTEPYDHRSMSIPFNENLEGGSDITKEINKPEDSNEAPPLPPMSDLAADFAREQSSLGRIRDPYSVLERPPGLSEEKESRYPSAEERELARMDENLKAPFTEENLEEDFATALMEPDHLEPGKNLDEDVEKSKHLLETEERPFFLEKMKNKMKNFRAKPLTAGGGNENGDKRGKEFHIREKTTAVNDVLFFTYPEAVEAVIAVEKTTVSGDHMAEVPKHEEHATEHIEKELKTRHKTKDKLENLIDMEGQLERSEVTEGPIEEATTVPDILTPLPEIHHKETTAKSIESSFASSHRPFSLNDEVLAEATTPLDEALFPIHLPDETELEHIMHADFETIGTEKKSGTESESKSGNGETTTASHHSSSVTPKSGSQSTEDDIEKIVELEGAIEKVEASTVTSSSFSVEEEAFTETPSEIVEGILRTLNEFEVSPEVYSTHSIGSFSLETEGETEMTHVEPDILTPLLMIGEEHVTQLTNPHKHTSSTHYVPLKKFPVSTSIPIVHFATTILSEEDLSLVTPLSIPDVTLVTTHHEVEKTEKHKKTKIENKSELENVEEQQEEIETNLAHLPKNRHETSTICEICEEAESEEQKVSTVVHPGIVSQKITEETPLAEEGVKEHEEVTIPKPGGYSTERGSSEEKEDEELDTNLVHLPKGHHETSTICEICDEESSKKQEHTNKEHLSMEVTTESYVHGGFKEQEANTPEMRTPAVTRKISHNEELQQEEFPSNLHHLPEGDRHETSTICEICAEEDVASHTTSPEGLASSKSHYVPVQVSETTFGARTTSELTREEKLEQEEFPSNLHHLPEHHVHETSTICEICEEEEEGASHTPSFSKKATTISPGHGFKSSQSPGESDKGLGFSQHVPEGVNETPSASEEISQLPPEEQTSAIPGGEISEMEGVSKGMEEQLETGEEFGTHAAHTHRSTLQTTTALTYNFEGEEIEQTMQTTEGKVFKVGHHGSTTEERISGVGSSTESEIEKEKSKFTIEEIETTEAVGEENGSTLEEHVSLEHPGSTMDKGLEAAENIEHKLEDVMNMEGASKSPEHPESKTEVSDDKESRATGTAEEVTSESDHKKLDSHTRGEDLEESSTLAETSSEIPPVTNFYTEFGSTVGEEISSTVHKGTTAILTGTSEEMVQVLHEIEKNGEESISGTEKSKEMTGAVTSSSGVKVEHTTEEVRLDNLEDRETTHIATDVSALLEDFEDIQKEMFFSTLGMEGGRESEHMETGSHTTGLYGVMETGEATSSLGRTSGHLAEVSEVIELGEATTSSHRGTAGHITEVSEVIVTKGATRSHEETAGHITEVSKVTESEKATMSIHEGLTEEGKSLTSHEETEIETAHNVHEPATEHSTSDKYSGKSHGMSTGALISKVFSTPRTEEMIHVLQEIEKIGEESRMSTKESMEVKTPASEGEAVSSLSEYTTQEATEARIEDLEERGTTHIATDVSALLENLEDIQEELFLSTLQMKEPEHIETVETVESFAKTGGTETPESVTASLPHTTPSMPKTTLKNLEEEGVTELGVQSTPLAKPEEKLAPSVEPHVSEGSLTGEEPRTEAYLSDNIEHKLEELNEAVDKFLTTTTKAELIGGDLENIEEKITETFLLEQELEDLNKEFMEMLETTLSADDLLEGLEQTSHEVVKGTLGEFEESTEANEKVEEHTGRAEITISTAIGEKHPTSEIIEPKEMRKEGSTESSSEEKSPHHSSSTAHTQESTALEEHLTSGGNGMTEGIIHGTTQLSIGSSTTGKTHFGSESTDFYSEVTSESTSAVSGHELSHTHEEMITTSSPPTDFILSVGIEKKLENLKDIADNLLSSTNTGSEEANTESQVLEEGLKQLKDEVEGMLKTTLSDKELLKGIESTEEIKEESEVSSETAETTSLSDEYALEHITISSVTHISVAEKIKEHDEKVYSDKIDTKLDELNEIIDDILSGTPAPEGHSGVSVEVEEESTESEILEKELEELKKEFDEILLTTQSGEEILEGLEETSPTSSEPTEEKFGTSLEIEVSATTTEGAGSTRESTEPSPEISETSHEHVEENVTEEADMNHGSSMMTEKTSFVPKGATAVIAGNVSTALPIEGVTLYAGSTEIHTGESTSAATEAEGLTNFYTDVVTAETRNELSPHLTSGVTELSSHATGSYVEMSSTEEKNTVGRSTEKLEEKLVELDEIINEFLTSTPTIEIGVEPNKGREEMKVEEEVLEKELEDLKHEFQLMLSTTVSPDNLSVALEDVLYPTTGHGETVSQTEAGVEEVGHTSEGQEGVLEEGFSLGTGSVSHGAGTEEGIGHTTEGQKATEGVLEGGSSHGTPEEETIAHSTHNEGTMEEVGPGGTTTGFAHTTGQENETAFSHLTLSETGIHEKTTQGEQGMESSPVNELLQGTTTHIGISAETEHWFHPTAHAEEKTAEGETVLEGKTAENGSSVGGSTHEGEVTEGVGTHTTGIEGQGETKNGLETSSEVEAHGEITTHMGSSVGEELHSMSTGGFTEGGTIEHGETVSEVVGTETSTIVKISESESYSTPKKEQEEGVTKSSSYSTSKSHTEGLSSISLLTTLLLSLVTSTTPSPEKSNAIASQFTSNASGPQNIPKCLVVFITGESPLLPLNGTKWVPSECPHLGEQSTTSHPPNEIKASEGTTELSTTSESTIEGSSNGTISTTTVSTTLMPAEELPEIRTKNFVEGGCSEADFENNNKCFCMLDLTVDSVSEDLEGANTAKTNGIKCSKFLKVTKGLVMRNDTSASLKRSRRSYLYLRYLNRHRRETVEYNKIDEVLANELIATSTDTSIYSDVGATATIPCVYKDEVIEREHFMKYVWTAGGDKIIMFSDRIREATDGALKISEVAVEDGGNYTCSINRPFGNTDSEHKRYVHELLIIDKPIFKVKSTVMYVTDEPCSLKDGDVVHAYLPKMLEDLLCGIHKRVCKVEMERPSCVEVEEKTYLTVKYIVTLDTISTLLPSISNAECDFNCQMKLMGSLVSLLIKNVETTSVLDVVSEIQSFNHTFKPREVKFPSDRSAVDDLTLLPKLVIGCPAGFGIKGGTSKICVACPRNTYNSENSSTCSPCPRVTYQPKIGSSSCIECKTPFDDKACIGMMFANKAFLILYVGSSVAIVFFILLCIFCAQSSTQAAFGGPQKKKKAQTPKRRRMGRKDVEDPAEKPLLPKDPSVPKIVKGPKVPPPDF